MPDEMLLAVGPVCNTLSLATLQSYMPASTHWKGVGRSSGLDPDKPSSYIRIFIGRLCFPLGQDNYFTSAIKRNRVRTNATIPFNYIHSNESKVE
jgi:hypothetical protein